MVYGSSYNYNMPGLMGGTGFMPNFGSGMGYSSFNSIFMPGGCNPFVTSYAQPNYTAMTGSAIAEGLLNITTMCVGAAIQGRKDNSVKNTFEDIELLKEKKADKKAELAKVNTELDNLKNKTTGIETASKNATKDYNTAKDALDGMRNDYESALINASDDANKKIIEKYKNQENLVKELKQKADEAQKKLEEHSAKVAELKAKKDELETEIGTLDAQIKTADEKADEQVLAKLLKRKNCSKYSEVGGKFDGNNNLITGTEVSTADAWAVVNAYKNALVDDDQRKTYAIQFKAIYNALSPEEQGDFHSVYRLMRDNHSGLL